MTTRSVFFAAALAAFSAAQALAQNPIVVSDAAGLKAALVPGNAGRRIIAQPGVYLVDVPLVVPEGASLEGAGVMLGTPRPTGFLDGAVTKITAAPTLAGDLLTLGNQSSIQGLVIEDAVRGTLRGNVVVAASRQAGDVMSATITECEIVNPNPSGINFEGPIGRAVVVMSRNPRQGLDPPPHDGAQIGLTMNRSIVRSPAGGTAIFAINFASHARLAISLDANVIGGSFDTTAGVSRPDQVTGSSIVIDSHRSLYAAPAGIPTLGWVVQGGAGTPLPNDFAPGATFNTNTFSSVDDRIEGFTIGILAAGATRRSRLAGLLSDNTAELSVQRLQIATSIDPDAADFWFVGAQFTNTAGAEYPVGDRNQLRVLMRNTTGSGMRQNFYADVSGPTLPENLGSGNRLLFAGSQQAFSANNSAIQPGPAAQFFSAGR